jgi:hypothetical protein
MDRPELLNVRYCTMRNADLRAKFVFDTHVAQVFMGTQGEWLRRTKNNMRLKNPKDLMVERPKRKSPTDFLTGFVKFSV